MKEQEFCIYEGRFFPSDELNVEHVIPLALGGVNSFAIRASKEFNSTIGAGIEGKLAAELAMWQRRNEFDVRGHSGKRPVPTFKSGRIEELDLPVQVQLDKKNRAIKLYSPRHGRFLEDHESAGQTIKFATTLDLTVKVRFAAKVALGAGYFAYGSKFAEFAQVEHLRALVRLNVDEMSDDLAVVDPLTGELSEQQKIIRGLGKLVGHSSVLIVPSRNDISICVTCLKEFCGILRVRADTGSLPDEGHFKWGHILASDGTILRRGSLERGLTLLKEAALNQGAAQQGK